MIKAILSILFTGCILSASAGIVRVGEASYSDAFPGCDKAGRNSYPAGEPQLSGKAAGKPAPTNDWWSAELAKDHADAIFNYPMTLKPLDNGLAILENMKFQAVCDVNPIVIGTEGLSCRKTTVCDYSDWSVTLSWGGMEATVLLGNPMIYFTTSGPNPCIYVNQGEVKLSGNIATVSESYNRGCYAFYAPSGCAWTSEGGVLRCDLKGKKYWSAALLPQACDAKTYATRLAPYAFVFPIDTRLDMSYDATKGEVKNVYKTICEVKEGSETKPLAGILPHHFRHIDTPPAYLGVNYETVRGVLQIAATDEFTTTIPFSGILPTLPTVADGNGYDNSKLKALVESVCADNGFSDWTDSYNDGQLLNRLVQCAEAAYSAGKDATGDKALELLRKQVERWFTYNQGDIDFMFYYHKPWSSMLAYPAGHGQDSNLNDHNFHYGYFIRAAALLADKIPGWLEKWGGMVDLLVRDVASTDRNDPMFPYLRAFSPYAGHCWANGTASLSLGNDQESTSEAMNFNSALILWGAVSGNRDMRDLGVCLYATEMTAIEQYWFDVDDKNLARDFTAVLASRVFGNSYDDQNFWGGGIAGSYGIQIYPVSASSTYLVRNRAYALKLWDDMAAKTGIKSNDSNPNIWYDSWLRFLSMLDAEEALKLYNSCTHLGEKFGDSQAHTYHFVHNMAKLGRPLTFYTADHPLATAYYDGKTVTYAARNYANTAVTVTYSDGYKLNVPAKGFVTATEQKDVKEPEVSVKPNDPSNPNDPNDPKDPSIKPVGETQFSGTEASEGTFTAPWHIGCTTEASGDVVVNAIFEGTYEGFAGPWLFDETEGFREVPMTMSGEGYSCILGGYALGTKLKLRIKIAFAGGLAVTKQIEYTVGAGKSSVGEVSLTEGIFANAGGEIEVRSKERGMISVFSADGQLILHKEHPGATTLIQPDWSKGLKIVRFTSDNTTYTAKILF